MANKVYFVLEPWEAVELICKVAAKAKSIEEKRGPKHPDRKLPKEAGDPKVQVSSAKLSKLINGLAQVKTAKDLNEYVFGERKTHFYYMLLFIRSERPVTIEETVLRVIIEYAETDELNYLLEQKAQSFNPMPKMDYFTNSSWWFYLFDQVGGKPGIVKGYLEIQTFRRVELFYYDTEVKRPVKYSGRILHDGDLVEATMKTGASSLRDFRILCNIGIEQSKPEVILGIYSSSSSNSGIYSGTVLLEEISDISEHDGFESKFQPKDSEGWKEIPELVRRYFSDKGKNYLKCTTKVTSFDDLKRWLDSKNRPPEGPLQPN